VLAWYHLQGNERPIYMMKRYPKIMGSRAYPIEAITEAFGDQYFGCQLDYMGAMALYEGFDQWILYGVGQPYCRDRTSEQAQKWWQYHGTFLYWLRMANKRGVEILFDTPASNLITPQMLLDEEQYPTPPPLTYRYGYDMAVEQREQIVAELAER
jgi:hypothetical protein